MTQAFHDHFSAVAARYADFRPHYPKSLFEYLASLLPSNSSVWDCAAGNGQATVDLARHFARVIGTDASSDQIASAKPRANVEYRVAKAEDSGLPDQAVTLITVAQAVHWFDFPKFYSEAKRVLKPRGFLAVWAYGINEVEGESVNSIVQDFYANVVGPYWPPERVLVEQGYKTIPFPFEELTPPEFHMETAWNLQDLLGYFSTWSATNRYMKANGRNPIEPLATALAQVWGQADSPRRIVWPLALRIGRV
jgi:ubiquinone/menaquinone biosynthesis C-methylase UbiE